MDHRKIENERRRLAKIEQVLRSKIWGSLANGEEGGGESKKLAEQKVAEFKKGYAERNIFESEEILSEYKIGLIRAYSGWWTMSKMEELIYFHLTNYLTESEKFQALNES